MTDLLCTVCLAGQDPDATNEKTPMTQLAKAMQLVARCNVLLMLAGAVALAGCGGGGGGNAHASSTQDHGTVDTNAAVSTSGPKPTDAEARRFLTQATFGPTSADVLAVTERGYAAWIDAQLSMPTAADRHYKYYSARLSQLRSTNPSAKGNGELITHSFWKQALTAEDQLRQRTAFALSQIFVVSWNDACLVNSPQGVADYMDMLTAHAFAPYRELIDKVAKHPVMGCYLSHLRNEKEDNATGRQPDENFARELLQLFSIGLVQLNPDGTPKKNSQGEHIETYTPEDIKGLAKVFTGWGFSCGGLSTNLCFWRGVDSPTGATPEGAWTQQMQGYSSYHSRSEKNFLGHVIPANSGNVAANTTTALDVISRHPNVAPFISKQLIQRFVTSNPSPAYISRVTQAFTQSGGNIGATVKALLLDPEAREWPKTTDLTSGKVREPIMRITALLRSVGATSMTGNYQISSSDSPVYALSQSPYKAPSVFNFYRPAYAPTSPGFPSSMVAPELQIHDETSTAAYVNYVYSLLTSGLGVHVPTDRGLSKDVQPDYFINSTNRFLTLSDDPPKLVQAINNELMYGRMSEQLSTLITDHISTIIESRTPSASTLTERNLKRLQAALLLTLASPEFLVQQ